jgi:glycosyltransferase involved in cell wall biosynthesis
MPTIYSRLVKASSWSPENIEAVSARTLNRRLWNVLAAQMLQAPEFISRSDEFKTHEISGQIAQISKKQFKAASALARLLATQPRDNSDLELALAIYSRIYAVESNQSRLVSAIQKPVFEKGAKTSISHSSVLIGLELSTGEKARAQELIKDLLPSGLVEQALKTDSINPFTQNGNQEIWANSLSKIVEIGNAEFKIENSSLPPLDRLSATDQPQVDGPLVTVIVTTYKPDHTLETAVKSLINQTYKNLEILIVDDASAAEFDSTLKEIAALDQRITLHKMPTNGGTYLARNFGIGIACGDFVTFHDSDDWSSPVKIQEQLKPLQQDPEQHSTISMSLRVDENVIITRLGYRSDRENLSSLLVRKTIFTEVGLFDQVRKSADREFVDRIASLTGKKPTRVKKRLSLVRLGTANLTGGDFLARYMAQERIQYRSAYLLEAPETRMTDSIESPSNGKRFPKPGKFFVNPEQNYPDADLVIIDNLLIIANDTAGLVDLIKAAITQNKRVHLVHSETVNTGNAASPKYKIGFSSPERFIAPAIMNLCKDHDIKISTLQSEVRTNQVIIRDPLFTVFPHSSNSGIKTQSVSLENSEATLPTGLTNSQANELMSKNIAVLFGVSA